MSGPLILSPRGAGGYGPLAPSAGASAESVQASDATATTAQQGGSPGDQPAGTRPPQGGLPSDTSDASAVSWLLAWGVLIVLLVLINRTQLGKTITYYVLALAVLFLVLTQYKFIAATLAPFQSSQAAVTEDSTGGSAGGVQNPAAAGSSDLTGLNG